MEGNLIQSLEETLNVLDRKFFISPVSFEGIHRIEKWQYPLPALREIILNILVHRNYMGAHTQIAVYDDNISFDDQIFQINTNNGYAIDSIIAPDKMITDAIFLPKNNSILMCYANDSFKQINISGNHDLCAMSFINGKFQSPQTFYTQSSIETDTNCIYNLNRPFRLTLSTDSTVFVSKKNEIVKVEYSTATAYSIDSLYYARDNHFGKGIEANGKTIILNSTFGIDFFYKNSVGYIHSQRHLTHPVFNTEYNPISRKMYIFNRLTTGNTGFFIYDLENEQIESFVELDKPIGDLKFNAARNEVIVSQFDKDYGAPKDGSWGGVASESYPCVDIPDTLWGVRY